MILDAYNRNYRRYVRDPLAEIKKQERESYDDNVTEVINFFNRKTNMADIRRFMIQRFATEIQREAAKRDRPDGTSVSTTKSVEHLIRTEASDAIEYKHIEAIDTGIGIRIVQALGNLLNQPDQYWLYTVPQKGKGKKKDAQQIEEVEALMNEVREVGKYHTVATEMDLCSCMVESAILHMYYKDKQLRYDTVLPSNIWLKYGSRIKVENDDGTTTDTWVEYNEIEDASAVIIKTASDMGDFAGSPDLSQYLAYVGCCTDYPEGRYVIYQAREPWPLPDENDDAIVYEHHVGETTKTQCNPLTYMRHHGTPEQQKVVTTEYPIVLWRGGHQMISDDRIPITTSLYENCKEMEVGWTRILRAALNGARGRDLITLAEGHFQMPKSLEVPVLAEGDTLEQIGWPASHSNDAAKVLQVITEQTAGGFSVPGYMVLGQLAGINPASGVALAIQTAPLIAFRNRRHRLNRHAMRRQFDIERAMLCMEHPDAQALLKPEIVQRWDPGQWRPPEDDATVMLGIEKDLDVGTTDIVAAVKKRHRLATDQEAEALIATWQKRDPQYEFGKPPEPTLPEVGKPVPEDEEDEEDEE
jgi:hypothetical protein